MDQPTNDQPTKFNRRRLLQFCAAAGIIEVSGGALAQAPDAPAGLPNPKPATGRQKVNIFMVIHRTGAQADVGFMDHLKNAGFDANFIIRNTAGDDKLLPGIVEEIQKYPEKIDLVYTQSTSVTAGIAGLVKDPAPEKFIRDIPIVFSMVGDPIAAKIVTAIEKPGRNVTGAIHITSKEVEVKAMLAYMADRPLKRLGMLYTPNEKTQKVAYDQLKKVTSTLKIELVTADPLGADGKPSEEELIPMLNRMAALKPDLVYIPAVNFFGKHAELIMEAAITRRMPTFCALEVQVKAGGLTGFVAPLLTVGALAGYKAEQILTGKLAAKDTKIEVLPKFSFIINLATARALNFYPSMAVLRLSQTMNA